MTNLSLPERFTQEELERLAERAEEDFRRGRREEYQSLWGAFYSDAFEDALGEVETVLGRSDSLTDLSECCQGLLGEGRLDVLRYMDRPTMSEDDFKTLTKAGTTSARRLGGGGPVTDDAAGLIAENLNGNLFPWLEGGEPTEADLLAAKRAVAALIADQRTKTEMRNRASRGQEDAVRRLLVEELGFVEAPGCDFDMSRDAPRAGRLLSGEVKVAGTKADVVFGLGDGRFMALECKVSNSKSNSFKRLNHEAVEKVKKWYGAFGTNGVVGGAVLQGVFSPANLATAQDDRVAIFWSFDLGRLASFVRSTGWDG